MSIEPDTIYLTLKARGPPGSFHWGLYISSESASGTYYHATNGAVTAGAWRFESRSSINPFTDFKGLLCLYRIGRVHRENIGLVDEVARSVPADGLPSRRTGQSFNCKVWVDDVLFDLHSFNVIQLTTGIYDIEIDAHSCAMSVEKDVGAGRRKPLVVTETYASTT